MSRYRLAASAIVLLGALLRFWSLDGGLPHPLTRPDEETVLAHAAEPARGEFDLRYAVYPGAYIYLTWAWCEALRSARRLRRGLPAGTAHPDLRHPRLRT